MIFAGSVRAQFSATFPITYDSLSGTFRISSSMVRGDLIVAGTFNAPAFLGIGAASKVLTSDGTDTTWQPVMRRTGVSANYTAVVADRVIGVTSTAAPRTITLPSAATVGAGKDYIVKDESGGAGTNNITLTPNGAETIDGAASLVISTNYGVARIYSNGTNWFTY